MRRLPSASCDARGGLFAHYTINWRKDRISVRPEWMFERVKPYRFTAGNPLTGNDRIIESERLAGRARWAVAATDSGAFSFNHSASSCLSRSMNQRPAGPGGLSVRYTADIAMA